MPTTQLRQAYLDILMEQVRSCRYPSPMMMSRLEKVVRDRRAAEGYVSALLDLMAQDRFPSPQLMERVTQALDAIERTPAG